MTRNERMLTGLSAAALLGSMAGGVKAMEAMVQNCEAHNVCPNGGTCDFNFQKCDACTITQCSYSYSNCSSVGIFCSGS